MIVNASLIDPVRIYAVCVVKNEDDVIAQTLNFASQHCDRIFVLDNGSTDETWNLVQGLAQDNHAIVPFGQTSLPFDNGLRATVYNAVHGQLSDNDWWLILDADEFLAEDPRPIIDLAVRARADRINAWHIQFFFTDRDASQWEQGKDSRDRPILERRRHYVINWQECRLFRNCSTREWDVSISTHLPHWLGPICKRRILNRHYQYRDPPQMDKRLRQRYGHHQFSHVRSTSWQSMICESKKLNYHADGDPWRFSASGVLYFYRHFWYGRICSAYRYGAMRCLQRLMSIGNTDTPSGATRKR